MRAQSLAWLLLPRIHTVHELINASPWRQKRPYRSTHYQDVDTGSGQARPTKLIANGRTTGRYRLAGTGLTEVPAELYNQQPVATVAFWEEVPAKSVDLSRNQLEELPEQLSHLAELETLAVSHNQLRSLPSGLMSGTSFTGLLLLDVSHNRLTSLGAGFSSLTSLKQLSCAVNQLSCLEIGNLPRLVQLSAEGNKLQTMPENLKRCKKLLRLKLSANALTEFPDLQDLIRLEELDFSANTICGSLPPTLGYLTALRSLNLRQNRISSLPAEISQLLSLTELCLGFNRLQTLPPEIAAVHNLRSMDLKNNSIQSLPNHLTRLQLTLLDLTNNDLRELPPDLGLLSSLRAMPVVGNPIRGLRPTVLQGPLSDLLAALRQKLDTKEEEPGRLVALEGCQITDKMKRLAVDRRMDSLSLADCKLDSFPSKLWEHAEQLRYLDLSGNNICSLPSGALSPFSKLEALIFARNQLEEWPLPLESDSPIFPLQRLDVSGNPRLRVPAAALASWTGSLTSLDLSGIKMDSDLCGSLLLGCFPLQNLRLAQCSLQAFPNPILDLPKLQDLDLASNSLTLLPRDITKLAGLSSLNLTNNSISALPPELGLLSGSLQILRLEGNPLRTIRRPILEKGTKAVLEYLRDRIPN